MLLTIGMIVKNEEKYLQRCLEGLKPILEQIDCELIIADTGSTDNTVNIAKKFTNNVFYFEWCNDFSKARNFTLEKASGEWYMQIDADEIITDAKPLIDFFNSKEYQQYKSARIIIRSSSDLSFNNYLDKNTSRLFKVKKGVFYTSSIHEYIMQDSPTKDLAIIVKHYGYISENNEDYFIEKSNRYLKLLLSELQKNPQDSMLYFYISNIYDVLGDYQNGLEYSKEGLKNTNDSKKIIHYADIIKFSYQLNKSADVIYYATEYFKQKDIALGTDIDVYILLAYTYVNLGNSNEAIPAFEKYFSLYKTYKKESLNTPETVLRAVYTATENHYCNAVIVYSRLMADSRNFEKAISYLYDINIEELNVLNSFDKWLYLEVDLMINLNDYSRAYDLKNHLNDAAYSMIKNIVNGELQKYFTGLSQDSLSIEYINSLCATYCKLFSLYQALSKEDLSEYNIDLFPDYIYAGFYYNKAEKAKSNKEYSNYIQYLKRILKTCPLMKNSINLLADQTLDFINDAETKKTEFEGYAEKVKNSIRDLISCGKIKEAADLLIMYEKLCPNDQEIEAIKKQIN